MPWECIRHGRRERSAGKPIRLRGGAAKLHPTAASVNVPAKRAATHDAFANSDRS